MAHSPPFAVTLQAFSRTSNEVVQLDAHPTSPLLLSVDEKGRVCVFDYEAGRAVCDITLAELGDKGTARAALFRDVSVIRWRRRKERLRAGLPATGRVPLSAAAAPFGARHIVIASDSKIHFYDYATRSDSEASLSGCGGVSAMELVPSHPWIALACGDGSVRIFDCANMSLLPQKLTGAHTSKGITALIAVPSESGPSDLASAASDGSIAVWGLQPDGATFASRFTVPAAHPGGVQSLDYHPILDALVSTGEDRTVVFWRLAAGATPDASREIDRVKTGAKKSFASARCVFHPRFPRRTLLLLARRPVAYFSFPRCTPACTGPYDEPLADCVRACDLLELVPSADPKTFRLSGAAAVHPTLPNLFLVGTTAGVALLALEAAPRPFVAVPLERPFFPDRTSAQSSSGGYGQYGAPPVPGGPPQPQQPVMRHPISLYYYNPSGKALGVHAHVTVMSQHAGDSPLPLLVVAEVQEEKPHVVADLFGGKDGAAQTGGFGAASAELSASGALLLVHSLDDHAYRIARVHDGAVVAEGSAEAVAFSLGSGWGSGPGDRYAVLDALRGEVVERKVVEEVKKGLLGREKKKEKVEETKSMRGGIVTIRDAGNSPSGIVEAPMTVLSRVPAHSLHGGFVLGLGLDIPAAPTPATAPAPALAPAPSAASSGGGSSAPPPPAPPSAPPPLAENRFAFFQWSSGKAVEEREGTPPFPVLPEPRFVKWDPSLRYCLLAYPTRFVVLSLGQGSTYRVLCQAFDRVESALWNGHVLFYSTPRDICVFFPAAESDPLRVVIASSDPVSAALGPDPLAPPSASSPDKPPTPPSPPTPLEIDEAFYDGPARAAAFGPAAPAPPGGPAPVPPFRKLRVAERPYGALTLVSVLQDRVLVVADVFYRLHCIPFLYPPLQARIAAANAAGRPAAALRMAEEGLRTSEEQESFAWFMAKRGLPRAAARLSRLTVWGRFELCLKHGLVVEAANALHALHPELFVVEGGPGPRPPLPDVPPEAWAAELLVPHATALSERASQAYIRLGEAASKKGNGPVADLAYDLAARLSPAAAKWQAVHLAKGGRAEELRALYARLVQRRLLEDARIAATLSRDTALTVAACVAGGHYGDAILLSSYDPAQAGRSGELAQEWGRALAAANPDRPRVVMAPSPPSVYG